MEVVVVECCGVRFVHLLSVGQEGSPKAVSGVENVVPDFAVTALTFSTPCIRRCGLLRPGFCATDILLKKR